MMKLFQEREAWALFKFTAIGEACGWSLLLYGIAAPIYRLPGKTFMLPLGGSIHGMLFLAYLGVILAGFTSLNWSYRKAFLAVLMSVIPFATWGFEAWCASRRRAQQLGSYRRIVVKPLIEHKGKILAIQPSTGVDWVIPGDFAEQNETLAQAAQRITFRLTGIRPQVAIATGKADTRDAKNLTFYFHVASKNSFNLEKITPIIKSALAIDELGFVGEAEIPELNGL